MAFRGSLVAALLATLAHPRWWVISLAAFLARGGVVLVLVPIVVPPSVAGVLSSAAPTVVGAVLAGGPNTPVGALAVAIGLAVFAWLAIAGTFGTWFDAALVAEAVADEDLGLPVPMRQPLPSGLGTVRLLPHLVTAIAFVVAAAQIFAVAYAEATSPGAPTTPFVVRVISQAPGQVVALLLAWLVAEAIGGIAFRDLLLKRGDEPGSAAGVGAAVRHGVAQLVRPRGLLAFVVVNVLTLVAIAPGWLAGGRAWGQLRLLFTDGADAPGLAAGLLIFVAVVLAWLALLGAVLAWRSAVWTELVAGPRSS